MLTASKQAAAICAGGTLPHRFSFDQWRTAVEAAGGITVADLLMRAARQECWGRAWLSGDPDRIASGAYHELGEVIRRFSGRLG
jgi:hypothetical protein